MHDDPMLADHLPEQDRQVRILLDSGRYDDAEAAFDDTIASGPNLIGGSWDRSTVLVHRATMAWRLGRVTLALELAAEGWAEFDHDRPRGAAAAHTVSMLGYLLEGHSTSALGLLAEAVSIARASGDSATLAHCLIREGLSMTSRAMSSTAAPNERLYRQAMERYAEALTLASPGAIRRRALGGSARCLLGIGEIDEAEARAFDVLRLSTDSGDMVGSGIANWVLGEVRRIQGRLEDARTFASRAVDSGEQIKDNLLMTRFSWDLGRICQLLGDHVGEAAALRRTVTASTQAVDVLQEGLAQALEQRRNAVRAQRWATAAEAAAVRDPLTGLTNRLGLERYAPRLLAETAAQGRVPWLILLDIDWFKDVNDTIGHAAGDSALQEIAALLRHEVRTNDLVCRWAGDEFVVLLVDVANEAADAGPLVAERIRAAVDGHDWHGALGPLLQPPTASIGVAAGPAQLDHLFAAADIALYEAKRRGRNRVEIDRPDPDDAPAAAP